MTWVKYNPLPERYLEVESQALLVNRTGMMVINCTLSRNTQDHLNTGTMLTSPYKNNTTVDLRHMNTSALNPLIYIGMSTPRLPLLGSIFTADHWQKGKACILLR